MKKKLKKAPSKKYLRNKCDQKAKEKAMEREEGICEVCGDTYGTTAHHYFYRSSCGHLRFYLPNLVILCRKCHFLLHFKDPKIIENKIIAKKGQEWIDDLTKRAMEKQKPSYQTIEYYKLKLKELQ